MAESNPYKQYAIWFEEAVSSQILDPYAACLSTATKDGIVSSRMLYIRGVNDDGFIFYTNYNSNKGQEIDQNKNGALNVFWGELERQIRIEGKIEKVSSDTSDQYFNARPRTSQLGAWASNQSKILKDRAELTDRLTYYEQKFSNMPVPRPPHWGGFCLIPMKIEFWQGNMHGAGDSATADGRTCPTMCYGTSLEHRAATSEHWAGMLRSRFLGARHSKRSAS